MHLQRRKAEILTAAGFYEGSVTVEARGEEGAVLRYTTDGETPTKKSKEFPAEGLLSRKDIVRLAVRKAVAE